MTNKSDFKTVHMSPSMSQTIIEEGQETYIFME